MPRAAMSVATMTSYLPTPGRPASASMRWFCERLACRTATAWLAGEFEAAGDLVGTVLGAGEHRSRCRTGSSASRASSSSNFWSAATGIEGVVDRLVDRAGDADTRRLRGVAQGERGDGRDLRRDGGGEEERLPLAGAAGDDVLDNRVGKKPMSSVLRSTSSRMRIVDVAETDLAGLRGGPSRRPGWRDDGMSTPRLSWERCTP